MRAPVRIVKMARTASPPAALHSTAEHPHATTFQQPRVGAAPMSADAPGTVRIRDTANRLSAAFVPGAGMIGVSLRHRGEELLGQRRGLSAYLSAGKTMGIPLLHPWANRLSGRRYCAGGVDVTLADDAPGVRTDPNGLPMHGLLAGLRDWTVEPPPREEGDERTELVASFSLADRPDLLASFPFPHEIEISATLVDATLRIQTTIFPTTDVPVPLAFGFHPYLTLPGVPREAWHVELPALRHRPVDDLGLPTGAAATVAAEAFTLGDRTFDDGYDQVEPGAEFAVSGGGRRIVARFEAGYPAAQIFAPAQDAVICFEPMAAPTNALVTGDGLTYAEPGRPTTATFTISVGPE